MSENTMTPVMDEPVQIVPFNSFAIYQVKDGDDYHLLRFASLESVEKEAASFRDKVRNEEAIITGITTGPLLCRSSVMMASP